MQKQCGALYFLLCLGDASFYLERKKWKAKFEEERDIKFAILEKNTNWGQILMKWGRCSSLRRNQMTLPSNENMKKCNILQFFEERHSWKQDLLGSCLQLTALRVFGWLEIMYPRQLVSSQPFQVLVEFEAAFIRKLSSAIHAQLFMVRLKYVHTRHIKFDYY